MFLGQYQHSLDEKGRVILPAKFRGQLEGGAYMARGLDGCVCVYPTDEWERVSNNMRELATRGTSGAAGGEVVLRRRRRGRS